MERFFNTEGPIILEDHYHIDPLHRLDWEEVQFLIKAKKYFVLHAPRQTGKTSTLLNMMTELNQSGLYSVLYANIEGAQAARGDANEGIETVCESIAHSAWVHLKTKVMMDWLVAGGRSVNPKDRLSQMLSYWSMNSDKPCVLFLDEVDSLVGDSLISLLRQIRSGYGQRPVAFPQSIVLCGIRDVQDYRIHSGGEVITGGSAFNIKAKSLTMGNFTRDEISQLYLQHSEHTGQQFAPEVFEPLWQDSQGQPWLVNALAYQMVWETRKNRDRSKTIELEDYQAAREQLIYSRATHLDQLSDKLKESRVHSVIAPMLATHKDSTASQASQDDLNYVKDLGLIELKPQLRISNRIYQEVIPRELTFATQVTICHEQAWYINADNRIDMPKLLGAFQQFFRENADSWIERFDYKEAGPQLLMQAFLQRVVNGGGRINREYALGRRRTDVTIEWPVTDQGFYGEVQRIVIELKIQYGALESCIEEALEQTADYADKFGAKEAHVVIFNRDANIRWDDKIWHQQSKYQQRSIDIWGC